MKYAILLFLVVLSAPMLFSQDLKLQSDMVASGGIHGVASEVNLSKWRLGEVHQVILQQKENSPLELNPWEVSAYPTPFNRFLYVSFKSDQILHLNILVTNLQGQKQLHQVKKSLQPNQTLQLDLDFLVPQVYLLTIVSTDKQYSKTVKIQKQ